MAPLARRGKKKPKKQTSGTAPETKSEVSQDAIMGNTGQEKKKRKKFLGLF